MADVEIVGFDPSLLERAAGLRTDVFGGTTGLNREYFAWKYERNPYLVDPLVHFAVSTDGVVGMRASMGTCWEVHGVRYLLPHGGDVLVDARFRRQGILRRMQHAYLSDLEARGFGIAFSLSGGTMGTPAMVAGGWNVLTLFETLEYTTAEQASRAERGYDRSRALVRRVVRARPVNPLSRVTALEDDGVEVLAGDAFDKIVGLAGRPEPGERLRHVRDAEYFRWRLGNPLSRYCVLASRGAYVILQWGGGSESAVNLVDWHAASPEALVRVLTAALRRDALDPGLAPVVRAAARERPRGLCAIGGRPPAEPILHAPVRVR
jgi:hypothetical protein